MTSKLTQFSGGTGVIKTANPNRTYAGRAEGVIPVNLTIDKDAYAILKAQAPAGKAYGRFVSRLLFEHIARVEERQKLRTQLTTVLSEEV